MAGLVPSELVAMRIWWFHSTACAIELVKPCRFLKLKWIVFTANWYCNFKQNYLYRFIATCFKIVYKVEEDIKELQKNDIKKHQQNKSDSSFKGYR